jgi:molybdopterin-synthase adenylyltransferase
VFETSVAIPQTLAIRDDGQENLTFALYTLSKGLKCQTALIHTLILPEQNDHQIHDNVSFNRQYLERVYNLAMKEESGIVFLHSHPSIGWQGVSKDDVAAEQYISRGALTCTELPLIGMTIGIDGVWSARVWNSSTNGQLQHTWYKTVKVVGRKLSFSFHPNVDVAKKLEPVFQNSVTVFGKHFGQLQYLRIGIVGLGSVGSHVAETLARVGFRNFVLVDFDEVQIHNLDRLVGGTRHDVGKLKIDVARNHIQNCGIAKGINVEVNASSVVEAPGYAAMLDCDVIFSCVDRPFPRKILNHIAYAHLIPVIDGGIGVRMNDEEELAGVDWQLQTATVGCPCLKCCGCYDDTQVDLDRAGLLDKPTYTERSDIDPKKRNENVFPFTANLSSLEVIQLIALITGKQHFGSQRYRFHPGILENHLKEDVSCTCMDALIGQGDRFFSLIYQDSTAQAARTRQAKSLN